MNDKQLWIQTLLKEDSDLSGSLGESKWFSLKVLCEFDDPKWSTLCVNEFCFDTDSKNYKSALKLAENLEFVLKKLKIPYILTSSGNWFHIHVFFDKSIDCSNELWLNYYKDQKQIAIEDIQKFLKSMRDGIFLYLIDMIEPVEDSWFDLAVVTSSRHMARIIGSKHEDSGYYKSVLDELPEEQPKITFDKVKYPSKIEHWEIPEKILYFVYRYYVKDRKTNKNYPENVKKTYWIEKLHEIPLNDGRHRVVDLIFIPYCKQILKWSEEETVNWIREWLDRSYELQEPDKIIYDYYITSKFRSSKLFPLSKNGVNNWLSEIPEFSEVIE